MATQQSGEIFNSDIIYSIAKESSNAIQIDKPLYIYQPPKVTEDYQRKYIPDKAPIYRQVQSVVVSQDPAVGQVVPAGTEVKLILAVKGTLPVGSFQVGPAFQAKYGAATVDQVLNDLDAKGELVKPILEQQKPYEELTAQEKGAVVQYAQSVGLGAANDADAKAAYEDASFFYNF